MVDAEQVRRTFSQAYLRALWRYVATMSPTHPPGLDDLHTELMRTAAGVAHRRHGVRVRPEETAVLGRALRQVTEARLTAATRHPSDVTLDLTDTVQREQEPRS